MALMKKKMSTSAYVLIALLIIAIVSLPILHLVGVLDLSFLGLALQDIMMWAATDALNGILLVSGVFVGGALTWHVIKTFLVGTKIPIPQYTQPYNMQNTVSNPQQDENQTVVS